MPASARARARARAIRAVNYARNGIYPMPHR
jgi:hypothetical protein